MKIFMAGNTIFPAYIAPILYGGKIYMAGVIPFSEKKNIGGGFDVTIKTWKPYILESFFYADADTERLIPFYGDFLLDSGAFTFMQGKGGSPDFDAYAERYADFIN